MKKIVCLSVLLVGCASEPPKPADAPWLSNAPKGSVMAPEKATPAAEFIKNKK